MKKFFLFCFSLIFLSTAVFAQSEEVTTITITNARETSYKKSEETGNDTIVLEGSVRLVVEKGSSKSEIKADRITYDRATEMLYAQGNVEITTTDSSEGGETTTASAFLLNTSTLEGIFDDGRIVQTQSDAINLPSGSTLIVFSDLFGKTDTNVIAFKNSSLTFCDDDDPHWHIDATRTWLLPGGEFAFFNALLYVGAVPVLYLPAFYYPKDELVYNPVFGYRKREGYFSQNTLYLYGRKPLEESSDSSSSDDDSSSAPAESLKALYNFMKPSSLKVQRLEGLVLHNLDEDYTGDTTNFLKLKADWYSTLGIMTGLEGNFQPSKKYLTKLAFKADLGFSNTIFTDSAGNYLNFSSAGNRYSDDSVFLGLKLPFRYAANLDLTLSKPFKLTVSAPLYSDPFFSYDFYDRSEYMDWISFFLNNASSEDDDDDDSVTEISSFSWKLSSSYSPGIPAVITPYVSSLSFSLNSTVTLTSLANTYITNSANLEDGYDSEWAANTPKRKFYYPSLVTPGNASVSVSGTLFKWPPAQKSSSPAKVSYAITLNKPDELLSEKELAEKLEENDGEQDADGEEKGSAGPEEKADEPPMPSLPELAFTAASVTIPSGLAYTLGYSASATLNTQIAYASTNLTQPEDFDWEYIRSFMYTLKTPVSLTSNLSYNDSFFTVQNKVAYEPVFQKHPYINTITQNDDETSSEYTTRVTQAGGYSESDTRTLTLADYKAESRTVTNTNAISIKPFYYINMLKDTGVSWNSTLKLFRRNFIGDADNPEWEDLALDWSDSDSVTENVLSATAAVYELDEKFKQTLTLASNLPPQLEKYSATLSLVFPYLSFSLGTGIQKESTDSDEWVKNPLQQSATLSLFSSALKFTQSFNYNLEDDYADSLKLSLTWSSLQFSYIMSYTTGYDFDAASGWVAQSEKKFLPYSLSLSFAPSTKTFYSWFRRVSVAPGINTSVVADLIRPTNSYLVFSPSLSFKINQFLVLTFSSTTRNSVLYRYFQSWAGHDGRIPGEQNIFKDLIDSFRFDDESIRQGSGFKLKSLNLSIEHYLHDWTAAMTLKIEPRLVEYGDGRKQYDYNPYITIGVVWNPMESMKTKLIDKYGEWELN